MLDPLNALFSSGGFMPHGHCYLWTPGVVWLHVISDALIALSYYSIPLTLAWFVRKRRDVDFRWMFVCFAGFILACGSTHVLEIWNVWHGAYWLSGAVKAITAAASISTAILLMRLMPQALGLPSPGALREANESLREENAARHEAEKELRESNASLEQRVAERTCELKAANAGLRREMDERKLAEEAVRESEELFAKSFRLSPDGVAIVRLSDRTVIRANEALCALWGSTPEAVIGHPTQDYTQWLDEGERVAFMKTLDDTGECLNYDAPLRLTDGRLVDCNISSRMINFRGEECILSVVRDTTERVRAENVLRRQANLLDVSFDAILVWEFDGNIIYWNEGAAVLYGYTPEEAIGQRSHALFRTRHPVGLAAFEEELLRTGSWTGELHHTTREGRRIVVESRHKLVREAKGRLLVLETNRDVTERKSGEDALRASETRYRRLFESSKDGILILDAETGMVVDVNAFLIEMLGYSHEQFLGKAIWELGFFRDVVANEDNFAELKAKEYIRYENMPLETFDGQRIEVEFISNVYRVNDAKVIQCSIRDVSARVQAERAVRESEEQFRTLSEAMPQIVWITRADGGNIYFNRRWTDYTGLQPEESLGDGWQKPFHPEDRELATKAWEVAVAGQASYSLECRLRRADGVYRWWWIMGAPLRAADGTILKWFGTCTDIHENTLAVAALHESEARFRTMANSIPQLAWMARADGFVTWYNQRWYDFTGTDPAQVEGWNWESVHDPKVLPKVMERWTGAIASGQPFEMEFPLRGADGRFRAFLTRVQPLKDAEGRVTQWFGTNTEVEALKQAEEKVRLLNAELEFRVTERTEQLESANKELEAFSYSVSHDLRAPLRAVDGFAQAAIEDYALLLPEDGRECLATIRAGAQRMGMLIDDLLTFSRLSRLPIARQTVDANRQVRETLQELEPEQDGRAIEIRIGELPPYEGDPALMKQVWVNLLSNALKYTAKRARALVEIGATQEKGRPVYFVRDNGTGFDMQYAHKLFGVFQRLHRQEEFAGTGVGLAIVQRIVSRHGGRIWAEAAPDRGATFSFTLQGEIKL